MDYDPVLEQHAILSGGLDASPAPPAAEGGFGLESLSADNVSRQVPLVLAVGGVAAVGALFLFRMAGIRFAFGANIGGS